MNGSIFKRGLALLLATLTFTLATACTSPEDPTDSSSDVSGEGTAASNVADPSGGETGSTQDTTPVTDESGNTVTNPGTKGPDDQPGKTNTQTKGENKPTSPTNAPSSSAIKFPLDKPVTYSFMLTGTESATFAKDIAANKLWQQLKKDTNVNITFQFLGTNSTKLPTMLAGKSFGDVIYGSTYDSAAVSQYIMAGKLQDISKYINTKYMPNLEAQIAENKAVRNMITAADGKIYTLPKITGLEGHYLESPIWINKKWLDKLGLTVPKTLDEFTNVLRAFATKDPNGNGIKDEIPYICSSSSAYMHTEALLGMWGLATKDSATDSFVQVVNKKVTFVPAQPAYKEAIKYLASLYSEGLMWQECFTANTNTLNAKLQSPTPVVGVFTSTSPANTAYSGDYVVMAPPKVPGYTQKWYFHPAIDGSKNQFFVTSNCKNVDILMAWMDQFYRLDIAMANDYGFPGEGRINKDANGNYTFVDLTDVQMQQLNLKSPTLSSLLGNNVRGIPASAYTSGKVAMSRDDKIQQNNYAVYKSYINQEIWPRPYYPADQAGKAASMTTQIFNLVTTSQSRWITGRQDIDAAWDSYLSQLKGMRLDDYIAILQTSYDAYLKGAV